LDGVTHRDTTMLARELDDLQRQLWQRGQHQFLALDFLVQARLCEADVKSGPYVWICRNIECWPVLRSTLQDLGCEITDYE
jgi:hypothetical protein